MRAAVSLNEAGLFDSVKQGASCTADYGTNLNVVNLQAGYDDYKTRLNKYLSEQGPDLTVGQVLGSETISARNYSILLGTLLLRATLSSNFVPNYCRPIQPEFRLISQSGVV